MFGVACAVMSTATLGQKNALKNAGIKQLSEDMAMRYQLSDLFTYSFLLAVS